MKRPAGDSPSVEALSAVDKLLVVSGSAAPVTARQIDAFARAGAGTTRLKASQALDPSAGVSSSIDAAVEVASRVLDEGRSVCVYTALGPDDEDTPAVREAAARVKLDHTEIALRVGAALGDVAVRLVERHGLSPIAVAGGDTSSHALRRMTPQGLAIASGDYATSAHVFQLSGAPPVEGLKITLKGGQVGDEGLFVTLRDGRRGTRP
jgi:uncharacterized protein YgbK (DUF1537 family)